MQADTQPKLDDGTLTHWPPLAHIARGKDPQQGDEALCGARLMGMKLDDAAKVCEECVRVLREEVGDGN